MRVKVLEQLTSESTQSLHELLLIYQEYEKQLELIHGYLIEDLKNGYGVQALDTFTKRFGQIKNISSALMSATPLINSNAQTSSLSQFLGMPVLQPEMALTVSYFQEHYFDNWSFTSDIAFDNPIIKKEVQSYLIYFGTDKGKMYDGLFNVFKHPDLLGNGVYDVYVIKTNQFGNITSTFEIPIPNPNRKLEKKHAKTNK